MNADGRSDIVVSSQGGLDVFEQSAAGTLQARCPFPTITPQPIAGVWSELAIGDLDGDGRPDVAASESDDYTRITRQVAPGSPVPTSVSIGPPGTAEIGIPFALTGTIDAGVHGCLGAPEVDVWRQLPGGDPTLLDTVALRNNSGTTTWMFLHEGRPGAARVRHVPSDVGGRRVPRSFRKRVGSDRGHQTGDVAHARAVRREHQGRPDHHAASDVDRW